ncbi:MAG TPA: serine/threonine-protein kinase [Ktedonobacteraceae bacterium]
MDLSGKQLGNYRVTRLIGHGGFADVFLGEHIYLKTQAAIKVLHTRVNQDQNAIHYFLGEAQTIARLTHPHIIRVLEFGIEEDTPYLVMEFAPNGTLRQHLPRQVPLSVLMAVYYVKQVASALQHAHNNQLIHRDVKPENFLLGANYEVLLGDFGISSLAHSSKSLSTQEVAGTIAYMAPEQIEGKPRQASDQYALGIVMYEWLTGRYPFTGSFMEIATQHMFTPPPAPRSLDASIPEAVEEIILTALAKKPEERFLDVESFARALEKAALSTLSPGEALLLAEQPGSPEMRDFLYKTLRVATTTAVPTLLPGEVATLPPLQVPVPVLETPARLSNETPATLAAMTGKRSSQPVSRRTFFGVLAGFTLVLGAGAFGFWELSTHQANTSANTKHNSGRATATNPAQTAAPSPTSAPDPTAEPTTNTQVSQPVVFQQNTQVYSVAWNHNGALVASGGNGAQIQIWNPSTGQVQNALNSGQAHIYSLAWAPDNRRLAASYGDGTAGIWDAFQNVYSGLNGRQNRRVNSIHWSPDGGYLVTASGDGTVSLWSAFDGTLLNTYGGHSGYVNIAAWSPDSNLVASGGQDSTLQIWNPTTMQLKAMGSGHTQEIISLDWSPDSQRIVTGSKDGTAKIWDAQTGKLLRTYTGHGSFVVAVAWSPDGQKIASGGGDHLNPPTDTSAQIWSPDTGTRLNAYRRHSNEIESIAWSPDGRRVISGSDDGTAQVWFA